MVKRLSAAIVLAFCVNAPLLAASAASNPVVVVTPPQPVWNALSKDQQSVLAPLAPEWGSIDRKSVV